VKATRVMTNLATFEGATPYENPFIDPTRWVMLFDDFMTFDSSEWMIENIAGGPVAPTGWIGLSTTEPSVLTASIAPGESYSLQANTTATLYEQGVEQNWLAKTVFSLNSVYYTAARVRYDVSNLADVGVGIERNFRADFDTTDFLSAIEVGPSAPIASATMDWGSALVSYTLNIPANTWATVEFYVDVATRRRLILKDGVIVIDRPLGNSFAPYTPIDSAVDGHGWTPTICFTGGMTFEIDWFLAAIRRV
jgi:hypothetical protein